MSTKEVDTADAAAEAAAAPSLIYPDVDVEVHCPQIGGAAATTLMLPSVNAAEPVMTVRQYIQEMPQTSFYTAYKLKLVVDGKPGVDMNDFLELGAFESVQQDIAKAAKAAEAAELAAEALAEAKADSGGGTSSPEAEAKLQEAAAAAVAATKVVVKVCMELDGYTVRKARAHLKRFKELLQYPPASPTGLIPGMKEASKDQPGPLRPSKKSNQKQRKDSSNSNGSDEKLPTSPAGDESRLAEKRQRELQNRLKVVPLPVADGKGLSAFYSVGMGLAVDDVVDLTSSAEGDNLSKIFAQEGLGDLVGGGGTSGSGACAPTIQCLHYIRASAWNPPPTQRRLLGDLMYLEVSTLDDGILHLTVTPRGFYVNCTNHGHFDPNPAVVAHESHDLLVTLLLASTSFSRAWAQCVAQATSRGSLSDNPQVVLLQLLRDGRADAATIVPQWNVPLSGGLGQPASGHLALGHTPDEARAAEDELNTFGMDDRGALRDWNDELQNVKDWPSTGQDRRVHQARAMRKVLQEFHEAAVLGAMAIQQGFVAPFNSSESDDASVFVFNNIFFSFAADAPEAYKAVAGEAAAWKSASHDLRNVTALLSMEKRKVNTLATALVDYQGRRIVAQGIMPGILQGDQLSRVVVGAVERGQELKVDDDACKLLEDIGEELWIAKRSIPSVPIPASGGEPGGEGQAVELCGPAEIKCIEGADGRRYLLEVLRTTPRDANWVRGDKGTKVFAEWLAARGDRGPDDRLSLEEVALLRRELVMAYVRQIVSMKASERRQRLYEAKRTEMESAAGHDENGAAGGEVKFTEAEAAAFKEEEEQDAKDQAFNVNVFMPYAGCMDAEQLAKDEEHARGAALFLWEVVLPNVTSEVRRGSVAPKDGVQLSESLHGWGVNLRYMGRLATLALSEEIKDQRAMDGSVTIVKPMPPFWLEMLEVEMAARALKHVLFSLLATNPHVRAAPASTVHLVLNCLVGTAGGTDTAAAAEVPGLSASRSPSGGGGRKGKKGAAAAGATGRSAGTSASPSHPGPADPDMTHQSLWDRLKEEVAIRFRYDLVLLGCPGTPRGKGLMLQLLRRACQRAGIRIQSNAYVFSSSNPIRLEDVVQMVPVSKSCQSASPFSDASDVLEHARYHLNASKLQSAYELASHAASLLQQVCSGLHK
jgi:protein TIF31